MNQFVLFTLEERTCALPRAAVRELLPLPNLWRPPGTPEIMAGFLNLGGAVVPVLWLSRLFGLQAPAVPALYAHILHLAGAADRPLALLVDRVLDVVSVADAQIEPVPPDASLNGCFTAELHWNGGLVHVLAPERILLAEEQQRLAAFGEAAQRRLDAWPATA